MTTPKHHPQWVLDEAAAIERRYRRDRLVVWTMACAGPVSAALFAWAVAQ